MRALYLIILILCVLAMAYRHYNAFIAANAFAAALVVDQLDDRSAATFARRSIEPLHPLPERGTVVVQRPPLSVRVV